MIAFIDETGTHLDAPITGVAAVLFDDESYRWFESVWSPLSARLSRPFHTSDCVWLRRNKASNPFRSWGAQERSDFLAVLASLVRDAASASFIANMHRAEFEAWAEMAPGNVPWLQSPYAMCVLRALYMVAGDLDDRAPSDTIRYVIEDSEEHGPAGRRLFERIERNPTLKARLRIGAVEFKPKGEEPGLVAPDLVGWLWQRAYAEADLMEKGRPQQEAAPLSRIWGPANGLLLSEEGPPVFGVHMDRKSLPAWALHVAVHGIHRDK